MEDNKYLPLGINVFEYNQIGLVIFSILVVVANFILGSSWLFLFLLLFVIIIVNLIWYAFTDISWNYESFKIKKFLFTRIISSNEFIKVDRVLLNFFVIVFNGSKYYYLGNYDSIFKNIVELNNEIRNKIEK